MRFLVPLLVGICVATGSYAQTDIVLKKKAVGDSVLSTTRELILPEPFNGQKALLALFPGRHYNLPGSYKNEMINWSCPRCKVQNYKDVNEDGPAAFPFANGTATRLMNIMDFKDSTGLEYKVISFNHSEFDEDGIQVSRFTGGLLGLAKFVKTDAGWKLRMYAPAIAAYGAFSQCPTPTPIQIGQDQYAFMMRHANGGPGGPFFTDYYMIAGNNGTYQQVMAAFGSEKTQGDPEEGNYSSWTSTYAVPASEKKFFRDVLVTLKGNYDLRDIAGFSTDVQAKMKKAGKKAGKFVLVERYVFKGAKGYELQPDSQLKLN
ncbi:hypothetical protein [Chitinophaga sp. Cy-1792]|uniref:hypothetical protein n=1 Tax=Chitinophaga sp. Cy-1792 TaxID=2608339 RepID=UPI001422BED0|nr:hypothetical protein [Chitinophaga sp. Cy-1792]NIG54150.1 hypothetical protein [Chitinophaga sp. Cy-1792]